MQRTQRRHSYPEGHWRMRTEIPFSMGVLQDDLFCLCGQADLEGEGLVRNTGDLRAQTAASLDHIQAITEDLGCDAKDLAKLVVYFVPEDNHDHERYQEFIATYLGGTNLPVITFVPIRYFFYPGMMVEIDAYGVVNTVGKTCIPGVDTPFSVATKIGRHAFLGPIQATNDSDTVIAPGNIISQSVLTLEKMDDLLLSLGAMREDIVKINNWYVGSGTAQDWSESARVRANYYPEPGPVATGIPVERLFPKQCLIQTDCWVMLGEGGSSLPKRHVWPENHWDWPIHLPFKHGLDCDGMLFVGGQVSMDKSATVLHADDMEQQTKVSMGNIARVLYDLNEDFDCILKMNTFYRGGGEPGELHRNLDIRAQHFDSPGPASTGIPFTSLAYPGMEIEIEAIGMSSKIK